MAHTGSVICFHQRPLTVFVSPRRYVQGPGATHELGRELQRLGLSGRVLFVAGRTAQRDLQPIWQQVLPEVGLEPVVIAFGGECSKAEINRLVQEARSSQAVALVGAGGGKASDTARAVADELNLPAIITPTLASTDSPCSALSVTYSEGGSVEGSRFYNRHPLLVLVDTQVVARAPTPALERVVEANNLLSGLGFESGGLAVAHAVHNGITEIPGSHDYIHGEKVAFGLLTQLVLEGQPQTEINEILHYQKAVGLPITLAQVGVDANNDDQLQRIAARSVIPGESSHNEPFPVTAEALVAALKAADQLGRTLG